MTKLKNKDKETVILIRIPEVTARKGEATLTVTRGELGHLQTFAYSGLTLKGNLAETVQRALATLAQLEMTPPVLPADTNQPAETPASDEVEATLADEADEAETEAESTVAPAAVTRETPLPTDVSSFAEATDNPVHQQIALF